MSSPTDEEAVRKHLELIQNVISRLGNNQFLVRGWAITLVSALLGLAVNSNDSGLALVALAPIGVMWRLDASLLRSERLFRLLYERVRTGTESRPLFMNATDPATVEQLKSDKVAMKMVARWKVLSRPALAWLYIGLILATAATSLILHYT